MSSPTASDLAPGDRVRLTADAVAQHVGGWTHGTARCGTVVRLVNHRNTWSTTTGVAVQWDETRSTMVYSSTWLERADGHR